VWKKWGSTHQQRKLTFRGAYYLRLHCKITSEHHTTHCQHADATVQACTTVNTTMLDTQHTVSAAFTAGNATAKRSYSFCVCKTSSALISLTSLPSEKRDRYVSLQTCTDTIWQLILQHCLPLSTPNIPQ